jgi:hypothetical protein
MTGTNCDLFTHKSVPVIFEPPCIMTVSITQVENRKEKVKDNFVCFVNLVLLLMCVVVIRIHCIYWFQITD